MATPVTFPEVNVGLTAPADMTDEQCRTLPVFTDGRNCISCWQLDEAELAALVANGGKIWLGVVSGKTQPPVFVQVDNPIHYSDGPMPEPMNFVDPEYDKALAHIAALLPGVAAVHLKLLRAVYERGGQPAVVQYLQPYAEFIPAQLNA